MKLSNPIDETLARIDAANDAFALQLSAAGAKLNESYWIFWAGSDEEIVARLNHLGPAKVVQVFEKHAAAAAGINALIDLTERPDLIRHRAIAVPARPVVWDAGNATFMIESPEPEA